MNSIEMMARRAKSAARMLRSAPVASRAEALKLMADELVARRQEVLEANAADIAAAGELTPAFKKRLTVDEKVFN